MALSGTAFLALWNDRAEDRADYEAWHSREHIPERLGIPGILAGRRYVDGNGPLPAYFTLYSLADLEVLSSQAYAAVIGQPTPWSRSMRPALSRMYRRGCHTQLSLGAGVAGHLAATLLRRRDGGRDVADFGAIADMPPISALHLGQVRDIAPLPFEQPPSDDLPVADAILLIEGFDEASFAASLDSVDLLIARSGHQRLLDWTCYRLAFALDQDEVSGALLPSDALLGHFGRNVA